MRKKQHNCLFCGKKTKNKKYCSRECANRDYGKERKKANQYGNSKEKLICKNCKQLKNHSDFSYKTRGDINSGKKEVCKRCSATIRERKRKERTWKDDAVLVLYNNSKQRAKRQGINFTLKKEDIMIPNLCPVFGIELKREKRNGWLTAPSVDRINNKLGYTKDNIVIVSKRANILKNDATIRELIKLADFYGKYL